VDGDKTSAADFTVRLNGSIVTGNTFTGSGNAILTVTSKGRNSDFGKGYRAATITITVNGIPSEVVEILQKHDHDKVYAAPGVVGIKKSYYDRLLDDRTLLNDPTWRAGALTLKGSSTYAASTIGNSNFDFIEKIMDGTEHEGLASEEVYTVYFKWGSMVAIIGGMDPSVTNYIRGKDTWSVDDVVWYNDGFNPALITDDFTTFTYAPKNGGGSSMSTPAIPGEDNFNFSSSTAKQKGHGDICTEIGGTDWVTPKGYPWRISDTNMPFGNPLTPTPIGTTAHWTSSVNTGFKGNGAAVDLDNAVKTIFLPAAGNRGINGNMVTQGSDGRYWTSTAMSAPSGYVSHITFLSTSIGASNAGPIEGGLPVRCVVAAPPIAPIDTHSQGNIIYFAGIDDDVPGNAASYDNNYLSLGTWGKEITAEDYQKKMAVFKWGSVVGMDLDPDHDDVFNSNLATANNAVKFNPRPTSSSFTSYGNVPYSSGSNIETTNYANVQAGKGDPCKLIGLTVAELRGITNDSDLTALLNSRGDDYKGWRLPTRDENCIFTDGTTSTATESYGANVIKSDGTWSASAPGYVTFVQGGNAILPAAGYRDASGAVTGQGTYGRYWSATPSSTYAYNLYFNSADVGPAYDDSRSLGRAVRCVRP
jgi:hypothetical protein